MILVTSVKDIFKDSFIDKFSTNISLTTICITLIFTFLLSLFIYFMYKITSKNVLYSKKFNTSMALISIITSAIVLSMQANITVSLGMVGALSIVRFRTAIKEPRDLLFLFWSISNGIIIGTGIYSIALILAVVMGISLMFFDLFPDKKMTYILVIYFNKVKKEAIENIISKNKIKYKLKSENLSNKESSYIYEVKVNKNTDFMEEILKLEGINEANLMSQDGEIE